MGKARLPVAKPEIPKPAEPVPVRPPVLKYSDNAREFLEWLDYSGWRVVMKFQASTGSWFELWRKGQSAARLLIEVFPDQGGFEVWKPLVNSPHRDETMHAVMEYAHRHQDQGI